MKIQSVYDKTFSAYGKIVEGYDFSELLKTLEENSEKPKDSVIYVPSVEVLENVSVYSELKNNCYGGMPIQIGYCNGTNTLLNCYEYHRDSEIDIAADDVVLLVAKEQDIIDGQIDSSKTEAFLCPKGVGVELYATTLHYAPCSAKKGEGFRVIIVLPKYTNEEIVKKLLFKDILSFLSPIEKYVFSKTNKDSLINYMKTKGAEAENLLDKYNKQKEEIEKILNKNQNIKVTKENFFNDNRLSQIFNLLDDSKYLEIFNDKSKVPDDSIIFVFKLFFLLIKGTDKLIELKNDIFWEKISTYFINNTNEFNQNDYLLGELIKKILEQKLDFSELKIQKIHEIIEQVDLRQINPNTFKDSSPTTAQFCFIIGYFMEFFGIIDKDWNPLEIEYKELNQKINDLIKKINKIGLYIDVFFKGHLAKMMGLKNGFSSLYEKFMKRFSVSKPEYEEDADSEALFDQIFGSHLEDDG